MSVLRKSASTAAWVGGKSLNREVVVQDIYPAIHLTDSDFAVITQAANHLLHLTPRGRDPF